MRSRPPLILGVVVILAAAAWVVWRLSLRDTTTPVSASEVIEDVTDSPGGPAPSATTLPTVSSTTSAASAVPSTAGVPTGEFVVGEAPGEPGLYVYATSGFEEIDALGGARHDYPAETFVTLQPGGCGVTLRWTALEERWDELELCSTDGGKSISLYDTYHGWFGQSDLQQFTCGPPDAVAIPEVESGSWSYECSTDERTELWEVEVISVESLLIDGETVDAVHVRVTSTLSGASIGASESDTWYLRGTSLILRRVASRSSTNESLIGDVNYSETYEINLSSLQPEGARVDS